MADTKIVFIAFAIEDEWARNLFTGQSVHPKSPFEFVDMSVKEAYETGWKDKVRTRIKRSHGVIALVGKNSTNSTGQKWEIDCAKEEKKKIKGIWINKDDYTTIAGVTCTAWTWDAISNFIDSL
jgi:hypothetical protein